MIATAQARWAQAHGSRKNKNKWPPATSAVTSRRSPPSSQGMGARSRYLRQPRTAPVVVLPAYVQACASNPNRTRIFWVYTWKRSDPTKKTRSPYVCGSWKCEHCRKHASHVLYERVREAFLPYDPAGGVFIVLTLRPDEHARGHSDLDGVYKDLGNRLNKFMKRLRRYLMRMGYSDLENKYVSVIEAHLSGVPHINLVLHCPEFAAELRRDSDARQFVGQTKKESIMLTGDLLEAATDLGFGVRSTAEANRSTTDVGELASYVAKVAKHADKVHGEVAKLSQVPTMAPLNFRRVRSGKKFLPPKRRRDADTTGTVLRRWKDREGATHVEPLIRSENAAYTEEVARAVAIENEIVWQEEQAQGAEAKSKGTIAGPVTGYIEKDGAVEIAPGVMVVVRKRSLFVESAEHANALSAPH